MPVASGMAAVHRHYLVLAPQPEVQLLVPWGEIVSADLLLLIHRCTTTIVIILVIYVIVSLDTYTDECSATTVC